MVLERVNIDVKEIIIGFIHQIPLKPKYDSYMFHCPTCNSIVRIGYSEVKKQKCKCGQAIDWSE